MTAKYIFILVCLGFAIASRPFCGCKKSWFWLVAALFFTAAADYFLVIRDMHLPGIAVFCFAHVCYFMRVTEINKAKVRIFCALAFIVLVLFSQELLFVLAGLYATLFGINIWQNIKSNALPTINKRITIIGLLLFMLCDINVLLLNLPRHFDVPRFPLAFALIWVFYLPAQGLLAISGIAFPRAKE